MRDRTVGYVSRSIAATSPYGTARVLLYFDPAAPAVRSAFNVSSVTDNGTGDFTVIPAAPVSTSAGGVEAAVFLGMSTQNNYVGQNGAFTAASFPFLTQTDASAAVDADTFIAIFWNGH